MPRLARSASLLTALAATLWLTAGTATASRTVEVPSKVSIQSTSLHFSGKVTVPAADTPCRNARKVVLFKVVSGGPDQAVGHATTNVKGAWSVTPQGSAGISLASFYAKVKPRDEGTAGTIYVCKATKSKTIKPTT